ncbi:MAG: arylsulfotransferase family protein [Phycisphaerae bacterium]
MRWLHVAGFGGALLLALLGGCGGNDDKTEGEPQATDKGNAASVKSMDAGSTQETVASDSSNASRTQEEVEAILAMPYAGWVEDDDEEEVGLVFRDEARSYPGYTLFVVRLTAKALLIDHAGQVVHEWQDSGARQWGHAELLPDGDVLLVGADRPDEPVPWLADETRHAMRLDWNGGVVWKRYLPVHHDIATTPDGNLMALAFQRRKLPAVHQTIDVRDDLIVTLTPQGERLARFSFYDAVIGRPGIFPLIENPVTVVGRRPWVDLFHANSVEWMRHGHLFGKDPIYGPDNVLVCFRRQHRLAIFDMKKQEVIWAWGEKDISGPHDAQVLEDGRILLFDNGVNRGWSRVIELDPLRNEVVWEFKAPRPTDFYTESRGSAQRLPNGNTLIANSDNGEIFEVTREGDVVWRYLCAERNEAGQRATIVRAKRFESAFIEELLLKSRRKAG